MKKKIFQIKKSKSKKKLVCLTAYSKPIAKVLDKYCDMILVGDSIATAFYGMENTKKNYPTNNDQSFNSCKKRY